MTPWVARLIFLNFLMYGLIIVVPGLGDALMFVPALFLSRPWTIVTYMFLHGGLGHIFFNMLVLFFFGPRLEARMGGRRFLGLYLTSGIVGGLLSFTSPMIGVIGASGAVYGVMLAFAYYWPREVVHIWGVLPIEVRWLVLGMTVLSVVSGFGGAGDGIAHFAHLGGFLGAWIYLKVMDRTSGTRRFQAQAVATAPSISSPAAVARWSHIQREGLHPINLEELDRVMAKLQQEGVARLTDGEKEFLERFSQR
ncbi:MAG: rhomboid family intramembrane serine protease [Gemmatimonadales bacterium]|nr:MAG: rhomboid family intramembrane serine protease [Gemmatimonadales bacterium]